MTPKPDTLLTPSTLAHTLPAADAEVHLRAAQPHLVSVQEKETLLRAGVSYGTLLTPEGVPTEVQTAAYRAALIRNGERVGALLASLTAEILATYSQPVLVSLARAGTPVGCAMRRLARRWGSELPHHTLSIIRGSGIDGVALQAVRRQHPHGQLIFVDGWTGKGSIYEALVGSLPADIPTRLAVLSDPAGVALHAATHDDLLLPHAALNASVCGLLSRTFVTEEGGLHAARIEEQLRGHDHTAEYLEALDTLTTPFTLEFHLPVGPRPQRPYDRVTALAATLGVTDPHLVKPSVGEATRVFLRRQPAHLMLREAEHPDTLHLQALAEAAQVPVSIHPTLPYLAAALIAAALIHPGGS
ncbi:cysteine protease StiP domain-containing protein [Deinococcus sp. QL22]|uniref:cysteine protease StiP domain-containing protein n=1 Tax=Deinococcus sp. QL22 TaxID=2939437 RepID=UPI002017666E|nr:cysteine protease StiP domain-containing protein [Deinococcus sp. QL22]UQN09881.1 cysteine protease StiP family protein [Deinococcus sp. QL22]